MPRSVVGDLPTPITLYNRNISSIEEVFSFACLSLSKHGVVFDKPHFITRCGVTLISELMHCLPNGSVVLSAKASHQQLVFHYCHPPEIYKVFRL
ncbi:Uncharacterised protein [Vibrio cholerae]|nr:Uncharacterised protein [Vibrio cholerae]